LMLPQDMTESILADALVKAGGRLHSGYRVEDVAQDGGRALATIASADGRHTIAARYVVGADGMHSVVRGAARIPFTGAAYEESFNLADVEMEWGHGRDEVTLFFSPAGLVVVAPLPGGAFRIVATVAAAPEHPTVADMQTLLDMRGPTMGAAKVRNVIWGSRFRLHHRLADEYRRDRLLLVGDAAHVHSPAGGQGMNAGLVDARVLGGMLADVVTRRRDPALLDTYQKLRRPAAGRVMRLADRLTWAATMTGTPQRLARNLVLSTAGRLAFVRGAMAMSLSGLSHRDDASLPSETSSGASPVAPRPPTTAGNRRT